MMAETAAMFSGERYKVKLHSYVYLNNDSKKWVILCHANMLNGKIMSRKIGSFYYEWGYNVLAIDSRGFGKSKGSVAVGFLEALDLYDWIIYLNKEYKPEEIILHGCSLGGATVNFISGIDGFMKNGTHSKDLISLKDLGVKGLVEDSGYIKIGDFKSDNKKLYKRCGLFSEEDFEYYGNALNSLKYCDIPMMVIHGDRDTMVTPDNAEKIYETLKGKKDIWMVRDQWHIFILLDKEKDAYKAHLKNFIDSI
ncbi:MAG: alpha/beta hydrolase [Erysipelotrichaceae bacterium]|nr:alpha/beta hydrolase [Erysipelotrichaceae bacterium]